MIHSRRIKQRSTDGQAMVEFALVIPFVLLCLIAIIFFGKAFYVTQTLSYAAQQGAKAAARTPKLQDSSARDAVRGFSSDGAASGSSSVISSALGAAHLLSNGETGDLPPGAKVLILPFDGDGNAESNTPTGTISVLIEYPFSLLINPFTGTSSGEAQSVAIPLSADSAAPAVPFPDFVMRQKATVSPEIYQEGL